GQKAEDISEEVILKDVRKPMSLEDAKKLVDHFNSVFVIHGYDTYAGPMSKNKPLSADTIRQHKKPSPALAKTS
ncbi:MAG: hypothetical protein AAF569_02440, partial [Pseudomonadota bacterium]